MAHCSKRSHQWKKVRERVENSTTSKAIRLLCGNTTAHKRTRSKLPFILLSFLSCSLLFALHFDSAFTTLSFNSSFQISDEQILINMVKFSSICSSFPPGAICCDRSGRRSDVCFIRGDIRTNSDSSSIIIYSSRSINPVLNFLASIRKQDIELQRERIRPYTRKWETSIRDTVRELHMVSVMKKHQNQHSCDVWHDVPAVVFSTGGYTGNVYHEFNDGIVPLYITSQHFNKRVVFVILDYHNWWFTKYNDILSVLSDYPPVDFGSDRRTHCFPEAIIGLRIHDDLTIDASLMEDNKKIGNFRALLDEAYIPRIKGIIQEEREERMKLLGKGPSFQLESETMMIEQTPQTAHKPKLVLISRNGSRVITNEDEMVKMAEEVGFDVEVLLPDQTTELARIYRAINSSDVLIGVHGAALAHFLFLRQGSVFMQIIPLGAEWPSFTYFEEPAMKFGVKYIPYKISVDESSLRNDYSEDDPILRDPRSVVKKGWQFTKDIYLSRQNVTLDLRRFQKPLAYAYKCSIVRKR